MTGHPDPRPPARAGTRLLPPLLLAACLGLATLLGAAAPPRAAALNVVRYIRPVLSQGPVTYDVCLYSSVEFPMRDEVAVLSIGGRGFINSRYVQGGDLHTLIFSLTLGQFQSLKNGDPIVVYYGRDDASDPAAQWVFGTFGGLTTVGVVGTPVLVSGPPLTGGTADIKRAAHARASRKGGKR